MKIAELLSLVAPPESVSIHLNYMDTTLKEIMCMLIWKYESPFSKGLLFNESLCSLSEAESKFFTLEVPL